MRADVPCRDVWHHANGQAARMQHVRRARLWLFGMLHRAAIAADGGASATAGELRQLLRHLGHDLRQAAWDWGAEVHADVRPRLQVRRVL